MSSILIFKSSGFQILKVRLLLVALIILTACGQPALPGDKLEIGLSQPDVKTILGEPSMVQEFEMPDGPFFGPQEALLEVVEPGAAILEWAYEQGEDVLYIWFSGGSGWPTTSLRVVAFATFPKNAVF